MSKKAALSRGSRRRSRQRRRRGELSSGFAHQRRRAAEAGRGALRRASLAAGQNPVRHDRRARARGDGRGLSHSIARRRRRPTSPSGSASTSCAPRSRSPTRAPIAPSSPSGAKSPSDASGSRALRRPARFPPRLARDPAARRRRRDRRRARPDLRGLAHRRRRVPKGGVDFVYGDAFPHDANFDLLHGVDFDKGCYVGQEVVSRMKHRGTARKRIARVKTAGPAPPPGTPVLDRELAVGTLGSSSGREALALMRTRSG